MLADLRACRAKAIKGPLGGFAKREKSTLAVK
jgi:hypothetical protein